MSIGTVTEWHNDEGWGVIDSPDTPGGCWAHYSHLWAGELPRLRPGESMTVSGGFREVFVGETVDFDWEPAQQDGYDFRATDIRPRRDHPRWTVKIHPPA
ncbi:hypothetical protein [Nocardia cyriacigeorgica]|uniref:hypothetical protein n=1 Tax=Nocardia cyriacigeorgica TaxID=135487 RepID=UPI00245469F8|nr:hypothetical protein [Nocardia cyriacigeorgica]